MTRLRKGTFDLLQVQLLSIHKRQRKDNAYVQRTDRTDNEEFYVPTLQSVAGLEEHFTHALKYIYTFNCLRPHFGKPMPGKTPSERVQEFYPGLTKLFSLHASCAETMSQLRSRSLVVTICSPVTEGLRDENSVAELCRKHGISQATYYQSQEGFVAGAKECVVHGAQEPGRREQEQ